MSSPTPDAPLPSEVGWIGPGYENQRMWEAAGGAVFSWADKVAEWQEAAPTIIRPGCVTFTFD